MPKTEFFTLDSREDGLNLSMMLVRPDGEIRALVQLAHGMTEHKERYAPFMEYLAERGCLCVINDHRGHGASLRAPEDLGYLYDGGADALVKDMHRISLWMKEQWPDKPLILFGHSMGSLAARAYCGDYDSDIDALVLSGSPGQRFGVRGVILLLRLLIRLRGARSRSPFLQGVLTGMFARRFPDAEHPCAWISANRENVIAYEANPLCRFIYTLNGDLALMNLMRRAYSLKPGRGRADLPVRFYSGADDPCAPDAKGFAAAMEKMRRAGYGDVQGHMFPGLRHEILQECSCGEIFEHIWHEAMEPRI